ncbi:MAG: DNA cytosine methyltransferase, partial [Bacteroidota bacterium]
MKEKFYAHPTDPSIGIGVILPFLIYPKFRSDVDILSTVQLELLRLHSVFPPLTHGGPPFIYKLDATLPAADPHDASELMDKTTVILGSKDGYLTVYRSKAKESFKTLLNCHDGQGYDRDKELQRLHRLFHNFEDLHMDSFPEHMQFFTKSTLDVLTADFAPSLQTYHLTFPHNTILLSASTTPLLRLGLVGPGLCQESTHAFRSEFSDKFQVTAVWEIAEGSLHADKHAQQCFPLAAHFGCIREWSKQALLGNAAVPELDVLVVTLPCRDNTRLKQVNDYATTRSADLFTDVQFHLIDLIRPTLVLNEQTVPHAHNYEKFEHVLQHFHLRGYSTEAHVLWSCFFGDYITNPRWFCIASLHPFTWNPLTSAPFKAPPALCSILDENPPVEYICGTYRLFHSSTSFRSYQESNLQFQFPYSANLYRRRNLIYPILNVPEFYQLSSLSLRLLGSSTSIVLGINRSGSALLPSTSTSLGLWVFGHLHNLALVTPTAPLCTHFLLTLDSPTQFSSFAAYTTSRIFTTSLGFYTDGSLELSAEPPQRQIHRIRNRGAAYAFDGNRAFRYASVIGAPIRVYGFCPTIPPTPSAFLSRICSLAAVTHPCYVTLAKGESETCGRLLLDERRFSDDIIWSPAHYLGYDKSESFNGTPVGNVIGNKIYSALGPAPIITSHANLKIFYDDHVRYLTLDEIRKANNHNDHKLVAYLEALSFRQATYAIANSIPSCTHRYLYQTIFEIHQSVDHVNLSLQPRYLNFLADQDDPGETTTFLVEAAQILLAHAPVG